MVEAVRWYTLGPQPEESDVAETEEASRRFLRKLKRRRHLAFAMMKK